MKSSEPLDAVPSIEDLLPNDILPSTIMANQDLANAYSTKTMVTTLQAKSKRKRTPVKGKKKKRKKGNEDESEKEEDEDDEEHDTLIKKHDTLIARQSVRLQIRLLRKKFALINSETQNKTGMAKAYKKKIQDFDSLLSLIDTDEDLFKPNQYQPDHKNIPRRSFQQLIDFYTQFQEIQGDDNVLHKETQKFLLLLYSSAGKFDDFVLPTNYMDASGYMETIMKSKTGKPQEQQPNPDS
jgi:hypothetical protein